MLDQRFQGLVIAISSRFHVIIKERQVDEIVPMGSSSSQATQEKVKIIVNSPQFLDGNWMYEYDVGSATLKQLGVQDDGENKFVAAALSFSLGFIVVLDERGEKGSLVGDSCCLDISIAADNDFYSQVDYVWLPLSIAVDL